MAKTSPSLTRLYDGAAYDTGTWPDSHWVNSDPRHHSSQLTTDTQADFAVIGAGYAGLNAAIELAQTHGADVVVLDAGQPGWGASGRNAGFCCMGGSKLGPQALIKRYGHAQASDFIRFQRDSVAHVDDLLNRFSIDAKQGPEGELCLAHSDQALTGLREEAALMARAFDHNQQLLTSDDLAERGLGTHWAKGGVLDQVGFPLNPMRYVQGLARAAQEYGVRLYGDTTVTTLKHDGAGWALRTVHGTVRARKVLIAANGYGAENLPHWMAGRSMPVLSTALTTRPLTLQERSDQNWTSQIMAYDSRDLLHYFRLLPDNRLLIGMRGAVQATPAAQRAITEQLREHMGRLFPAWAGVEIAHRWSGLICLTRGLTPFAGPIPGALGLFGAFGWHGNGVAMASFSGKRLASLMAGEMASGRNGIPALMQQPPRQFPLPAFRRAGLAAYYLWRGWRDGPLPR